MCERVAGTGNKPEQNTSYKKTSAGAKDEAEAVAVARERGRGSLDELEDENESYFGLGEEQYNFHFI